VCYDGPGGTRDRGVCRSGTATCAGGAFGVCEGQVLPSDEACNGEDDDCDGHVDEGLLSACGDCEPLPAEICNGGDDDCDGQVDEGLRNACGDCGAVPVEVCNGVDDDCDGEIDEDFDLENDVANCGRCGARCDPVRSDVCVSGTCRCGEWSCPARRRTARKRATGSLRSIASR